MALFQDSDIAFLEPPHSHDPTQISHVCALPSSMLSQLPESVQEALWSMQESASIAYASYMRLQSLLQERFTRLSPAASPDSTQFSEPSFHTYASQIDAEQSYLLEDAFPDFRHKSRHVNLNIRPYSDYTFKLSTGETTTIAAWWAKVQGIVNEWRDDAQSIEVPEFEDTVSEFHASQSTTPISEDGPKAFGDLKVADMRADLFGADGAFAVPASPEALTAKSGSKNEDVDGHRTNRSDSGVGLVTEEQV